MEKKKLPIPVNVVEQADFIAGFGTKELIISGITLVISIAFMVIIYLTSEDIVMALGLGTAILAVTITVIRRDRYDECLLDKIGFVKTYSQSQKQYCYLYYNIYEGGQNGK